MDVPTFVVIIGLVWLILNLVYRVFTRFFKTRTASLSLKYGVLLIVKKRYEGRPLPAGRRAPIYICIALYAVSLSLALFTLIGMIHAGIFAGTRSAVILIPGLNISGEDLLYFLLAAAIGIVLHEYLHARTSLSSGIPVKSFGVALLLIMPAAFVEIDEETFKQARKKLRVTVLAAGVAANLVVVLLSMVVLGLITTNSGFMITDVRENGLAYRSGLRPYDVVYKVNGTDATFNVLGTLIEYLNSNESLVFVLEVFRPGLGYMNLTLIKEPPDNKLGVTLYCNQLSKTCIAPSKNIVSLVNAVAFLTLHRIFSWIYVVNYSLLILNSLPLFITDGGRIFKELLGERLGNAVNTGILLILLIAFLVSVRI
ncbi:MAG: M50 family metallopeptidase [Desulfurococcaceae archaeon]